MQVHRIEFYYKNMIFFQMNSFNKTEAAVFSCRLCFLRAFPFISFLFKYLTTHAVCHFKPRCNMNVSYLVLNAPLKGLFIFDNVYVSLSSAFIYSCLFKCILYLPICLKRYQWSLFTTETFTLLMTFLGFAYDLANLYTNIALNAFVFI